jgi:cyclic-di-GMP phosphodiesterase TipF (flagellum assembly factor)
MLRVTAIFVAICAILIAASLGASAYLLLGLSAIESGLVAFAALLALMLYNALSARAKDRADLGARMSDISRGVGALAQQVAELGRRVAALEGESPAAQKTRGASDPLVVVINELGGLVRQLAETAAAHETRLSILAAVPAAQAATAAPLSESEPVASPQAKSGSKSENMPARASTPALTGYFRDKTESEAVAEIKDAVEAGRIDLYLQPVLTLPQRKVRFYEAMTRLRAADDTQIMPADFLAIAERAGLMPKIDNLLLFRCVQVLRRLLMKNREIGLFCNVSATTLNDSVAFAQFLQFMEANRALASSLLLEFTQESFRAMGPLESESLASLRELGFRFSMDHVRDLQFNPRELSERGIRFTKVPASLLLNRVPESADIHTADLSDLLGRHGISLIAERIETEAVVLDLLDYDVRFGQGFLFAPPRPVRAEALQGSQGGNEVVERAGERGPAETKSGVPGLRATA